MPLVLRMEKLNKYTFNTPNDGSTGAQYRGVITFVLTNMEPSPLCFIIHDMQMLLHTEKKVMLGIIKAYDAQKSTEKQVFIAFDRLNHNTETKGYYERIVFWNCRLEKTNYLVARGIKKRSQKMAEKKNKKETSTHFNYNRLWKIRKCHDGCSAQNT